MKTFYFVCFLIVGVLSQNPCNQGFWNGMDCMCDAGWTGPDCSICEVGSIYNNQRCAPFINFGEGFQALSCASVSNLLVPNDAVSISADLLPNFGVARLNSFWNESNLLYSCDFSGCTADETGLSCQNTSCYCTNYCNQILHNIIHSLKGPSTIQCSSSTNCTFTQNQLPVAIHVECSASASLQPSIKSNYLNSYWFENDACYGDAPSSTSVLPTAAYNCFPLTNGSYIQYAGRTTVNPNRLYTQLFDSYCPSSTPYQLSTIDIECQPNFIPNIMQGTGSLLFDFTEKPIPNMQGYQTFTSYSNLDCTGQITMTNNVKEGECMPGLISGPTEMVRYTCNEGIGIATGYEDGMCAYNVSEMYYSGAVCAGGNRASCFSDNPSKNLYGLAITYQNSCGSDGVIVESVMGQIGSCQNTPCAPRLGTNTQTLVSCVFSPPTFPTTHSMALMNVGSFGAVYQVGLLIGELEPLLGLQIVVAECLNAETAVVQNCASATQCAAGFATLTPQGFTKIPPSFNLPNSNITLISCNSQ